MVIKDNIMLRKDYTESTKNKSVPFFTAIKNKPAPFLMTYPNSLEPEVKGREHCK